MLKTTACALCTDKTEKKISLKYKEIQKGSGAKSYMREDFSLNISEYLSVQYMRKQLFI